MIKVFSMFSGIGGFELGILNSIIADDVEFIGHSEIDKYAEDVYQRHFGGKNYGDATRINTEDLPDFDFLVGGFPCQAFSIAGLRRGFDDTRGTLFFEIARILRDKRPKRFLLENVEGILSHDKGETIQTIFQILTEMGYDISLKVYNSKDFGVPQNRKRTYIAGYLRGRSAAKVFPLERTDGEDNLCEVRQIAQIFGTEAEPNPSGGRVYDAAGGTAMRTLGAGHGMSQPYIAQRVELTSLDTEKDTEETCRHSIQTE